MKGKILRLFILFFFISYVFSQDYRGEEAKEIVSNASVVRIKEGSSVPNYVKFERGREISFSSFFEWLKKKFGLVNSEFVFINSHSDELGYEHFRYFQKIKGYEVKFSMLIVHVRNGLVESFNGVIFPEDNFVNVKGISLQAVRDRVLRDYPDAVYVSEGVKVWFPKSLEKLSSDNYVLTYEFLVEIPKGYYERANVYYDVVGGNLLKYYSLTRNVDSLGTVVTKYSGTHPIISDYTGTNFRLREAGRGNGIETYNANNGDNPPAGSTDFFDDDNYWNNFNANLDEVAGDVHWGSEKFYDFLLDSLGRNSIDNNGYKLVSYVHVGQNWTNASWNGSFASYGDGSGNPLTTLDIVAHELAHGLTDFTANLIYYGESGALNESFSDIFGAVIEWYATPSQGDWLMGEDMGWSMRDMSNPKAKGDPDTYLGLNWYSGTADNGGVHINSGVQNYWFYLLSEGGSGTNDFGTSYNITGIGVFKAIKIAYRTLSTYLTPSSDYSDARYYSIISALELYGGCSPEVIATTNAWNAVGIGDKYVPQVIADFDYSFGVACSAPFLVKFYNKSNNSVNFTWDFGDGTTSNVYNPVHNYTSAGVYTVKLIADEGACGKDTMVKQNIINISPNNPCSYDLGSRLIISDCSGYIFDNGGPANNYSDNAILTTNFDIPGANAVKIKFLQFNVEAGYDSLVLYHGFGSTAVPIAVYTGSDLPNNGNEIIIPGGKFKLSFYSDHSVNYEGFIIYWECVDANDPPIAMFEKKELYCSGVVEFKDTSLNNPTSWSWDFGDGNTSNQRNPIHSYAQSGNYTVKLIVSNSNGSDTISRSVVVRAADTVNVDGAKAFCDSSAGKLIAKSSPFAITSWYKDSTGINLIKTSDTLELSNINMDTTIYVRQDFPVIGKVGAKDNKIGPGAYYVNSTKGLVFDVYEPCTLKSVKVYAIGPGLRAFRLVSPYGVVLELATANLTTGEHRVILNFPLEPQNNYQLIASASGNLNLYRNSSGALYPYSLVNPDNGKEIIRIKKANLQDPTDAKNYYYFFYDWEVEYIGCATPVVPVELKKNCASNISYYAENIHIYPNPVDNKLIIEGKNIDNISIYNSIGKLITNYDLINYSNKVEINFNGITSGVYVLKINIRDKVITHKFIVN